MNARVPGSMLAGSMLTAWACCAGLPALAVEPPGSTYVAPMTHGLWHDDARRVDDDFVFSLALGRALDEDWNVELNLSRGEFDGPGGNDLVLNNVGLNALRVFYRDSRIAPYFLLGAGWQEHNTEFDSTEHDPYADTGFGLLAVLSRPADGSHAISLRGEVRGRHTFIRDNHRLADYLVGIGVQFAFGGGSRAPRETEIGPRTSVFDADADGIRDDSDRCPGTPAAARIDETGCERDSDRDGVKDSRDKCPGSRPSIVVDASGCEADSDQDGVLESKDRCPDTPRRDRVDALGCSLTLRLEVFFATNSAQLEAESHADLDQAAALLRAVPSISGVIEGHTDSAGADSHNLALSRKRADAVRDYLVEKGVEASRLSALGLGESQPIADNSTPEGRAQNRRVLLRRTDQR